MAVPPIDPHAPARPLRRPMRPMRPLPALIFASRWLQVPFYLGLIVAQGIYVAPFVDRLTTRRHPVHFHDAHAGPAARPAPAQPSA